MCIDRNTYTAGLPMMSPLSAPPRNNGNQFQDLRSKSFNQPTKNRRKPKPFKPKPFKSP